MLNVFIKLNGATDVDDNDNSPREATPSTYMDLLVGLSTKNIYQGSFDI